MFKIGEKVIFVGEILLKYESQHTVKHIRYDQERCIQYIWVDVNFPFSENNFITLKEYRKQKLEKICSSQEKN